MFNQEAINTIRATWLEITLAKLFGKYSMYYEDDAFVTLSRWRGKYYLINRLPIEEHNEIN